MDNESENEVYHHPKKLNTTGCCFICLKIINIKNEEERNDEMQRPNNNNNTQQSTVSLSCLRHCLQLNTAKKVLQSSASSATVPSSSANNKDGSVNKEIEVELCNLCKELIERFSEAFSTLERIQMEVNDYLEKIHHEFSEASNNSELAQNFSWRMATTAPEEHEYVENLRKEIEMKSMKVRKGLQPEINLPRMEVPKASILMKRAIRSSVKVKVEASEDDDDEQQEYIDEGSDASSSPPPPNLSPPHSPPTMIETVVKAETLTLEEEQQLSMSLSAPKEAQTATLPPLMRKSTYKVNPNTKKFKCNGCTREFSKRKSVYLHFKKSHQIKFSCELCKSIHFQNQAEVDEHKINCKIISDLKKERKLAKKLKKTAEGEGATGNDEEERSPCPTCGKTFVTFESMLLHQRLVHLNERRYKCDLCPKSFKMTGHLKVHKQNIHFGIKFICKLCNKNMQMESKLIKHEAECTNNHKAKVCELCGKKVPNADALEKHEKECRKKIEAAIEDIF